MSTLAITLVPTTAPPWTVVPSVPLGRTPGGHGTPLLYGLVVDGAQPARRLDLYGEPGEETYFAASAIAWRTWIVVGFGWQLYLVCATDWSVRTITLPSYFQAVHAGADYLLVVFGSGLARVSAAGGIQWRNDGLAVDGVEVDTITDGVIRGRGEWDPPGDWRPFAVSLASGEAVGRASPVA